MSDPVPSMSFRRERDAGLAQVTVGFDERIRKTFVLAVVQIAVDPADSPLASGNYLRAVLNDGLDEIARNGGAMIERVCEEISEVHRRESTP